MPYPVKTLSQLPLILRAYRKIHQLTQAALAEKLGISQQSYAQLEANPAKVSVERLFKVLLALNVELILSDGPAVQAATAATKKAPKSPAPVQVDAQTMARSQNEGW
jgi:HTH-type transcriptional regulator / antitoxin HipB